MDQLSSRRIFLRIIPGAVAGLLALRAFAQDPPPKGGTTPPKPLPPPKDLDGNNVAGFGSGSGSASSSTTNSSNTMHISPGGHGGKGTVPNAPAPDPKTLKANETGMKHDIIRLAELAEELKKQVEDTDSTKVLSLDMIRKTQEIEKLAHDIATLAKG
jgi:hypothetical protein